jgi:hypothetical protein
VQTIEPQRDSSRCGSMEILLAHPGPVNKKVRLRLSVLVLAATALGEVDLWLGSGAMRAAVQERFRSN